MSTNMEVTKRKSSKRKRSDISDEDKDKDSDLWLAQVDIELNQLKPNKRRKTDAQETVSNLLNDSTSNHDSDGSDLEILTHCNQSIDPSLTKLTNAMQTNSNIMDDLAFISCSDADDEHDHNSIKHKTRDLTHFRYYDANVDCNISMNNHQKKKLSCNSSTNHHCKETSYSHENWWNHYLHTINTFSEAIYNDPYICVSPIIYNLKYKKTCYRTPAVYHTWNDCPKSAAHPYVVKDRMITITDATFFKETLLAQWQLPLALVSRPKIKEFLSASMFPKAYNSANYLLHEIFEINNKCGINLQQWCQLQEVDDKFHNEVAQFHIKLAKNVVVHSPFTIGDISLHESLREYMKYNDRLSKQNGLHFMNRNNDLLEGRSLAMMHIASYGARTPWHHDLGLCTWLQLLYGEKNVKIWDVESSKLIEQHKDNEEFVRSVKPKWEIFLRPGVVLYFPAGCGHLVTTMSNVAVMICGSFLPLNQVRIGYEMAQFEDQNYLKGQGLDFEELILKATKNITSNKKVWKDDKNVKQNNINQRLKYLELTTKQVNWKIV